MKKGFLFAIFALSIVTFFGCARATDLTETESNLIARYASGALLNQAEDYDGKLIVPTSSPSATPTPNPETMKHEELTSKSTPNVSEKDSSTNELNEQDNMIASEINEIFGISGLDFLCKSYDVYTEYPKNKAYSVSANDQELVLVVDFNIKNKTNKAISIDFVERNIEYLLDAGTQTYKPEITLLPNGLNFINKKIEAGKTEDAILVYYVSRSVKSASNVTLRIQDANKEAVILVNKK